MHSSVNLEEDFSDLINSQMCDFDDNGLLRETVQNSEVSCSSSGYNDDNSHTTDLSSSSLSDFKYFNQNKEGILSDNLNSQYQIILEALTAATASAMAASAVPLNTNHHHDQLDLLQFQSQFPFAEVKDSNGCRVYSPDSTIRDPLLQFPSEFENYPSAFRSYTHTNLLQFSFPDYSVLMGNLNTSAAMSAEGLGLFSGSVFNTEPLLHSQDLEFQGENESFYSSDQSGYASGDMQTLYGNNNQRLASSCSSPVLLTCDTSNLDESTYGVRRLTVDERKEKINRYLKKRNKRNFTKKIKYVCRKTLADSRPRVRGRFAKNGESGEGVTPVSSNYEDEFDVGTKAEENMNSEPDFGNLSEVNSFICNNYQIPYWA